MSVDAVDSVFFNHHGQEIYAEKCGVHMGYLHEQRFVHRGYLQMLFYRTVIERLGEDAVVLGARVVSYEQDSEGVTLHLEHRDGRTFVVGNGFIQVVSELRADGSLRDLAAFSTIGSWRYDAGLARASSEGESVLGNGYYFTTEFQKALGSGHINPFLAPGLAQSAEARRLLEIASAAGKT